MRDSADSDDYGVTRRGKKRGKFRYDEATYEKRNRHQPKLAAEDAHDDTDGLPEGDRWSIWDQSTPTERGPKPHPKWLVTDLAAVDYELGVLKTGKEADVFLVRRGVPGTDRSCLLAAKRYRDATHRQFHRDAGYLEGRRVRESRVNRAVGNRSDFGRQAIAGQWANAEFNALTQLYNARVPVPYPVQIVGTELLLEFIGDSDGTGAPRLAETRPDAAQLASLWSELVEAMTTLAGAGYAHGDLSPYNLLVHRGRLVMIDLPQVVDVVSHPNGRGFLDRDAKNVATWFVRAGHPDAEPERLSHLLAKEARLVLRSGKRRYSSGEMAGGLRTAWAVVKVMPRARLAPRAWLVTNLSAPCSLFVSPEMSCPVRTMAFARLNSPPRMDGSMQRERRSYPAGTKEALFMLSRGQCYAPGCGAAVMRRLDGQWRTKAHVAHICGLNKESARFDESVSVPERNSFGNLLLLCKPHHDLVDSKALENKYPKETLIVWKTAREGEYAGDLLELGAVTEDTLRRWMTDAVADTRGEIANAFDRLQDISDTLIASLKQAALDFFDLPYLDPEDIRSLHYTATVFEKIPDFADALDHSAHGLRHLPDTTEILWGVTSQLKNLPDTADILYYAAQAIKQAGLDEFTRYVGEIKSSVGDLTQASSDLSSATGSVDSMTQTAAIIRETSLRLERAASTVRPGSNWSWRAFWWGTVVCALFVIAVLALGVHLFAGK